MAGGGKHRGKGVRVTRRRSEPEETLSEPEESGGREPTPGAPRQSAEREEPALAEGSTSQSAIEIAVAKIRGIASSSFAGAPEHGRGPQGYAGRET